MPGKSRGGGKTGGKCPGGGIARVENRSATRVAHSSNLIHLRPLRVTLTKRWSCLVIAFSSSVRLKIEVA